MSYAFVHDIAASWHDYQQVAAPLVEPAPAGLILHAAAPTDEGVPIIAIWESEPAWQRFRTEPNLARHTIEKSGIWRRGTTTRRSHA